MDLVNLRLLEGEGPSGVTLAEQLGALEDLRREGKLELHRYERILLIPGTTSVAHLEENLAAGEVDDLEALESP